MRWRRTFQDWTLSALPVLMEWLAGELRGMQARREEHRRRDDDLFTSEESQATMAGRLSTLTGERRMRSGESTTKEPSQD